MRILKYFILVLIVILGHNAVAQQTCCTRFVGTQIAGPPSPARFAKTTWDSVFTSRMYGGGPLLKCPEIEMAKTFLEYRFAGTLTVEETPRMQSSTLHMQLVDVHRGSVVKEGRITWHCVDWRAGACSQTQKDNVMTLAKSFHPLDELIYNYERIPERAAIEPEKDPIMSGKKMPAHLTDIRDSKGRTPQPWQRLLVKAEKGEILNGKPQEEYRVFKVGGGVIDLDYQAPDECKKDTETITIYNTCVIDPQSRVTPEREIAKMNFDIVCLRGSIEINRRIQFRTPRVAHNYNVEGEVPFEVDIDKEPPEIKGKGTIKVTGRNIFAHCKLIESGPAQVDLTGWIEEREKQPPLMHVWWHESWSSITTVICPYQKTTTVQGSWSSYNIGVESWEKGGLHFPFVDEHKIEAPFERMTPMGGSKGMSTYILHVEEMP